MSKTAIPLKDNRIIPRFDLATEILIIKSEGRSEILDKKSILLPRSSAEELCHLLLAENIDTLICGAMEEEYFEFLQWKGVDVFDSVAGAWDLAFIRWQTNQLASGDILEDRQVEGKKI
jgi:predicted Fe-Mo cluster-binding NifX family protein